MMEATVLVIGYFAGLLLGFCVFAPVSRFIGRE